MLVKTDTPKLPSGPRRSTSPGRTAWIESAGRGPRRGHEDRLRLVFVIVVSFTRHIDISRADGGTYTQRRQRSGILRTRLLIGPQFLPAR